MWTRGWILVLAVVAVGLLLLWVLGEHNSPEDTDRPALTDVAASGEEAGQGRGGKAASPIATVGFEETKDGGAAAGPAARRVVLRGRCVDAETEAPLAGCRVDLYGLGRNDHLVQEYEHEHGEIVWENPEHQVTKPDGNFEFRFAPPPPYQFAMFIRADARVAMLARWLELEPGTIHDCGNILMHRGVRVSGSIVDEAGIARGGAVVRLARVDRRGPRDEFHAQLSDRASTRKDGTFAFRQLLSPGAWRVRVDDMEVIEPKTLEIDGSATAEVLDIRVRGVEKIKTITGVVTDDLGNPVRGAQVEVRRSSPATMTKRDGTFTLKRDTRDPGPEGPLVLEARQDGYEMGQTDEEVSWGDEGVKIVLRRGLAVEIFVQDGETEEPVEDFSVQCFADPTTATRSNSRTYRVIERGHHPGGVLRLKGQTRGLRFVIVHPTDRVHGHSACHAFTVTDAGSPRQTISVFKREPVRIKVIRPDGKPVAGTHLDLVAPFVAGIDQRTLVDTVTTMGRTMPILGYRVAEADTDAEGLAEVVVLPDQDCVLRVLGPGHVPLIKEGVRLPRGGPPLTVTVESGATLAGRLRPQELLEQVTPGAEEDDRYRERCQPGLYFCRAGSRKRELPGTGDTLPLDPDGSFRLDGVPAGDWDVHLRFWKRSGARSWGSGSINLATVRELRDGEERRLDLDCSHLLKATVEGRIELNGKPAAGASISLDGLVALSGGGVDDVMIQGLCADEQGRFSARVWPGEYRLIVQTKIDGEHVCVQSPDTFRVQPGASLTRSFSLTTTALQVRVFRSDGITPAKGVRLHLRRKAPAWPSGSGTSDAEGLARFEHLGCGVVEILALPGELSDPEAHRGFFQGGRKRLADVLVPLGSVTVSPGGGEVRFTLPATAGY